MLPPIWITRQGDLGIVPEGEYYQFGFDAYNPGGGAVTYSLITGSLPQGLEIKNDGTVIGIPLGGIAGVPADVAKVTISKFTIRIKNSQGLVADRTFSLTVAGILPQQIVPVANNLGSYVDGSYVDIDINTIEPNPLVTSKFRIIGGSLPAGLTLNPVTGLISGYLVPVIKENLFGEVGTIWSTSAASNNPTLPPNYPSYGPSFDWRNPDYTTVVAPFDSVGFDEQALNTSKNFQFTIEADNGINIETKDYTIFVIAIASLSADTTLITADNEGPITADILGPYHVPVILTEAGSLGNIRQNTNINIKIDGKDFDGDQITYDLLSGSLPTGLTLDTQSGWITGSIPYGPLGSSTYTFSIRVSKTLLPEYIGVEKTFSLDVLGQVENTVNWNTPSNLGSLYTGQISELFVGATTPSGRILSYKLVNSAGRLPIGLELTPDGLLVGRASFETFALDSGYTTIDNAKTTFDQVFTFTIAAFDTANYAYSTRDFKITIVKRDQIPYENLYVTVMPSRLQRGLYNEILNDSDIFSQDLLYRADDPWFGKNTLRRSLFMTGLNPKAAAEYISSMTLNHYWKTLNWGSIKTAHALDENFAVKYEVVYIEMIDRQVNAKGIGPNIAVGLPANSRNISTIYPNSFPNMVSRLETGIGYESRSSLPSWMTSRQADGNILGFTRALVLCYTKPGKGGEIAYRVRQVQDKFKLIDFTVDRYEWDNSLSSHFDKSGNVFVVNNFVYASGTISSNNTSNVIQGLTVITTGSGTISGAGGLATITGNGTSFGTELRVGRPLYRADNSEELGVIKSISNSSVLTLQAPLITTISDIAYKAETSSTSFTTEIYVGDTIIVDPNVRLGTVKSIESDSNLTLYANAISTVTGVAYQHNSRDPVSTPGQGDKYLKYPQVGVIT